MSFHLFEMGNDSWGVFLKKFIEKTKISSQFIEPRGENGLELSNCKLYSINFPKLKIY